MDLFVNLQDICSSIPTEYDSKKHQITVTIHETEHDFKIVLKDIPSDNPWENRIFHNYYIQKLDDNFIAFAKIPKKLMRVISPTNSNLTALVFPTRDENEQFVIKDNIQNYTKVVYCFKHKSYHKTNSIYMLDISPESYRMASFGWVSDEKCKNSYTVSSLHQLYLIRRINLCSAPFYSWEYAEDDYPSMGEYINI